MIFENRCVVLSYERCFGMEMTVNVIIMAVEILACDFRVPWTYELVLDNKWTELRRYPLF